MILPWLVVAACLLSEAFFAAAELSIISANRIRLEEAARKGSAAARRVLDFRDQPERLFSATLLGTNLSTVTGSTVATLTLLRAFPEGGELLAVAVMAPLILVLAEVLPKSIAQARANEVALRLAGPLHVVSAVLGPLVALVRGYATLLYRGFGLTERHKAIVSREELILLMDEDDPGGEIEPDEREMISRIFAFSGLRARDIYIPLIEVCAISESTTVKEAAAVIAREGFSRLPIYRDRVDEIVGILHHIDLMCATDGEQPVAELMQAPHFVPENQEIDELLIMLQRSAASAAIVVDEFGGAVGLLTLEDILEEIVGEIDDEFDHGARLWRPAPDGGHLISGRAPISRLNEELNLGLAESLEYETLAGFMLYRLRHIPRVGEKLTTKKGLQLTVHRANERAIEEVHVAPKVTPSSAPRSPR